MKVATMVTYAKKMYGEQCFSRHMEKFENGENILRCSDIMHVIAMAKQNS